MNKKEALAILLDVKLNQYFVIENASDNVCYKIPSNEFDVIYSKCYNPQNNRFTDCNNVLYNYVNPFEKMKVVYFESLEEYQHYIINQYLKVEYSHLSGIQKKIDLLESRLQRLCSTK